MTWSDQLYDIYGLKPGEFGGTFEDFMARHARRRSRAHPRRDRALHSRPAGRSGWRSGSCAPAARSRLSGKHGEVIKDERGNAVRMLGICQDVTGHEAGRRPRCARAKTQYRLMIESVRDYAIYMLDPAAHRELERGCAADQAGCRGRGAGQASAALYSTPRSAKPACPTRRSADRRARRKIRGRRLAPCARTAAASGRVSSSTRSMTRKAR